MVSRILLVASLFLGTALAGPIAPPLAGVDMRSGQAVSLEALRGQVVFVDFWASWCPPCLESLPAYDRMYRDIGNPEFEIIAVNVDEKTQDGMRFLETHPVSYPVVADPQGKIGIPWKIRSLPRSYLVDRDGSIVKTWKRFRPGDEEDIRLRIEALLEKEAADSSRQNVSDSK